jgi:predicted site-specific integrase-resolvase
MATYNIRLIKSRRSYSIKEMALLFGIDRKTCSRWIQNDGLRVVEKNVSPLLVMGEDLLRFIRDKRLTKKISLRDDEFYCFKCHKAVKAREDSRTVHKTGRTVGKEGLAQIVATGICEVCGIKVNRFLRVSQKN